MTLHEALKLSKIAVLDVILEVECEDDSDHMRFYATNTSMYVEEIKHGEVVHSRPCNVKESTNPNWRPIGVE